MVVTLGVYSFIVVTLGAMHLQLVVCKLEHTRFADKGLRWNDERR